MTCHNFRCPDNPSYINHLIHIIEPNDAIECRVQFVEKVHHLDGLALGTERRKPDNVAEIDGHVLKLLGLDHFSGHQLGSHGSARYSGIITYIPLATLSNLHLGNTWYNNSSVLRFSMFSCSVFSSTSDSKLFAYCSMRLSKSSIKFSQKPLEDQEHVVPKGKHSKPTGLTSLCSGH